MIRRLLALFVLLTLASLSAAAAHEHGMGHHHVAAFTEAAARQPVVAPAATGVFHHDVAWSASPEVSVCSDSGDTAHSHGKLSACTCPAACAGLFSVAVAAPPIVAETPANAPVGILRLSPTSAAPPTPPPRV